VEREQSSGCGGVAGVAAVVSVGGGRDDVEGATEAYWCNFKSKENLESSSPYLVSSMGYGNQALSTLVSLGFHLHRPTQALGSEVVRPRRSHLRRVIPKP
jgi:hypothetical protein